MISSYFSHLSSKIFSYLFDETGDRGRVYPRCAATVPRSLRLVSQGAACIQIGGRQNQIPVSALRHDDRKEYKVA